MKGRIGNTAGEVWHLLSEKDEMTVTAILKEVDVPTSIAYMAIGWLAREGKLEFVEGANKRGYRVRLKDETK
jgi:hypothetical protein